MKKLLSHALSIILGVSLVQTGCGKFEASKSSDVKIDPLTVGAAIYGAYASYQKDKSDAAQINSVKNAIRDNGQLVVDTIGNKIDEQTLTHVQSVSDNLRNVYNWSEYDTSLAAKQVLELNRELEKIIATGTPEAAIAAANSYTLFAPMAAIVWSLNRADDALINDVIFTTAFSSFDHLLKIQLPAYLRGKYPVTNTLVGKYIFAAAFTIGDAWMWDAQLAALYQIMAPLDENYIRVEYAQKQIAEMLHVAPTQRAYLTGFHHKGDGWAGYFNESGAFCGFASPQHMTNAGGNLGEVLKNGLVLNSAYMATLRADGLCKTAIPVGFIRDPQGNVFWSNGENAYCWVPAVKYITGPMKQYDYDIHSATTFRRDGQCASMP